MGITGDILAKIHDQQCHDYWVCLKMGYTPKWLMFGYFDGDGQSDFSDKPGRASYIC